MEKNVSLQLERYRDMMPTNDTGNWTCTLENRGGVMMFFCTFFSKNANAAANMNPYVQSVSGDFQKCSFTGKERDEETGFSYFGARYYDSDLSGLFLSVDPMADKYPGISPYAYCAWNPLKLVDPDGMELYIPDENSDNNHMSKNDILSLVKEKNRKYISFDKNGRVSISKDVTEGKLKDDKGLSLINDLIQSDKMFLYESSDDVSSVYRDSREHEMTDDSWTAYGIVNASSNGTDSRGTYSHKPKDGFDGHVILAKSGEWKETDTKGNVFSIRKSILFHELAENYYRTHESKNYNEAHRLAITREGFYFHRQQPGTIPRATLDHPENGFYYKGKHL